MDIADITATDLQDEIYGPIIIEEYREQVTKRMKDDNYMHILSAYVNSIVQVFESFLRTQIDLVEDDFKLILGEYISSTVTHESKPTFYTFKDLSDDSFFKIFNLNLKVQFITQLILN